MMIVLRLHIPYFLTKLVMTAAAAKSYIASCMQDIVMADPTMLLGMIVDADSQASNISSANLASEGSSSRAVAAPPRVMASRRKREKAAAEAAAAELATAKVMSETDKGGRRKRGAEGNGGDQMGMPKTSPAF